MSTDGGHSFIPPSSSTRSESCAAASLRTFLVKRRAKFIRTWGKYKFPEAIKDYAEDEEASKKGTMLHDVLKRELQLKLWGVGNARFEMVRALQNADADEFETDMMLRIAKDIVEQGKKASNVWIEKRFENEGVDSGGSPDSAMVITPKLVIRDLKTGRLEVPADISQLKRYGCGIMDELGWPDSITTIELIIDSIHFAPSRHHMSTKDLIEYRDSVFHPSMVASNQLNPVATPGHHCADTYCEARLHCPEYLEHMGLEYDPAKVFNRTFIEVTPRDLELMWSRVKDAGKVEDLVRDEMTLRLNMDMSEGFETFELKKGAQYKRIKDEAGLKKYLTGAGYGVKSLYKLKTKTATQLLKDTDGLTEEAIEPFLKRGHNKPSIVLIK